MIRLTLLFLLFLTSSLLASIGEISAVHGDATILREGKVFSVHMHTKIEEKDLISTHKNTKVQIIFNDNTIISLGQNSSFKVQEYLYVAKKVKARFNVKGLFKSITGKIGHIAPKNFTLKTQNATIGVRGTTIIGESTNKKDTIICSSGQIIVRTPMGNTIVNKGEQTTVSKNRKPSTPISVEKSVILKNENKMKTSTETKTMFQEAEIEEKKDTALSVNIVEVADVKEDWGNWNSTEDITKVVQKPQDDTPDIEEDRTDLAILREKAKENNPTYSGKVSSFVDTPRNQILQSDNHINLNFDLGTGVVAGDMEFNTVNERWQVEIENGSVDKHGAFDFDISNHDNIKGVGDGMLSGEELQHANGTFNMKNETNEHQIYGTFKADKN